MVTIKAEDLEKFELYCEIAHVYHEVVHVEEGVETTYKIDPKVDEDDMMELFNYLKNV